MKLHELFEDRLDEVNFRQAAVAGMISLASLMNSDVKNEPKIQKIVTQVIKKSAIELEKERLATLASTILNKYKIDDKLAVQIAAIAQKHEKPEFPRAEDILSIIGIESSFNPASKSKLKFDPAIGLMQVRPKIWKIKVASLSKIEDQVKVGTDILHQYYQKLGAEIDAVHAYNIGITNFRKKKGLNPGYVRKFENERNLYD